MNFHHTMRYPDGRAFQGKLDHQKDIDFLNLSGMDLSGLSVLDLATNDGFFAFWAEMHKASRVVAVDVGNYQNYDWGPAGPPEGVEDLYQPNKWEGFDFHHKNLSSNVEKQEKSIYDVSGLFDVIFNFGLLYHLRHPQLALDKCYEVCQGFMVLDTHTAVGDPFMPASFECGPHTGILTVTDFNAATESCVASWMWKAGFKTLFIERITDFKNKRRQMFIGIKDDRWLPLFEYNDKLFKCDDGYWQQVRNRIKKR